MNIYIINSYSEITWDCYDSHVIVANTIEEVVGLAQSIAANEGTSSWKEENVELIGSYIGDFEDPIIILSSFNAG